MTVHRLKLATAVVVVALILSATAPLPVAVLSFLTYMIGAPVVAFLWGRRTAWAKLQVVPRAEGVQHG